MTEALAKEILDDMTKCDNSLIGSGVKWEKDNSLNFKGW